MLDFVNGQPRSVVGTIVGVTREKHPHYDVQVGAKILLNLPEDRVKETGRRRDIFGVVK